MHIQTHTHKNTHKNTDLNPECITPHLPSSLKPLEIQFSPLTYLLSSFEVEKKNHYI